MPLPKRPLGKTGLEVSVISLSTSQLTAGKLMDALMLNKTARMLNLAIDLGINFIETSTSYGNQEKIGDVMKKRRNEVVLGIKSHKRKRIDLLADLHQSLKELQTDNVDILLIDRADTMLDIEDIFGENGALAAAQEARREGMVKHIGISGTTRPTLLTYALEKFDFDVVESAFSPIDHLINGTDQTLLPVARSKNVGVIAKRIYGHGLLKQTKLAMRYTLALEGVASALISMESEAQLEENVRLAEMLDPLSESDQRSLFTEARNLIEANYVSDRNPLYWLFHNRVQSWEEEKAAAAANK